MKKNYEGLIFLFNPCIAIARYYSLMLPWITKHSGKNICLPIYSIFKTCLKCKFSIYAYNSNQIEHGIIKKIIKCTKSPGRIGLNKLRLIESANPGPQVPTYIGFNSIKQVHRQHSSLVNKQLCFACCG